MSRYVTKLAVESMVCAPSLSEGSVYATKGIQEHAVTRSQQEGRLVNPIWTAEMEWEGFVILSHIHASVTKVGHALDATKWGAFVMQQR